MSRRAAIYARVSTETQEREGTSLESQRERCVAHAQSQGWSIEHTVEEQGSGGDLDGRPKLDGLLSLARTGQIDVLVCYHIDRLSRDVDDQGWLKRELRKAGVELVFVTGHQDPVIQAVEGAMGQQERRQIRERIKRGKEQTAKRGRYIAGGCAPYGYRYRYEMVGRVEKVAGLDEDPATAPILREIFTFVADGGTATACTERLNGRSAPTSKGGRWHHSTVCAIVRNPVYEGRPVALRNVSVFDPMTRQTRVEQRPVGEQVALPADVAPALVSPELWRRANNQLTAGQTGARRNNPEPERYLLRAGFIRCGYCGGALSASRVHDEPRYLCTQRVQRGCRDRASIRAVELDQAVWRLATEVLRDPAWIRQQLQEQSADLTLPDQLPLVDRRFGGCSSKSPASPPSSASWPTRAL